MVVIGQSGFIWVKMVVFWESGCIRVKVVVTGQSGFIGLIMVVIGKDGCIRKKCF